MRVAVAGAGYFARFHFDAWARLPVTLVGAAALDEAGVPDGVAWYRNLALMLDELRPDILDIVTPPATHAPFIALAAERGIDVICQKPFCGDLATARAAVARAQGAGIRLLVHENFRFQPWYAAMADTIAAGRLGPVYQATLRLRPGDGQGPDAYAARQPYFRSMERFLVHETLVHHVDVARYLLGEVTAVQADLRRINPAIAGEDAGLVIMTHAQGARSLLDGNRLADHASDDPRRTLGEATVEGGAGTLALDGAGTLGLRRHGRREVEPVAFEWADRAFGGDCVFLTCRAALDHLAHGAPFANTGRAYLINLAIEAAIYRAHESGCRQTLETEADADAGTTPGLSGGTERS